MRNLCCWLALAGAASMPACGTDAGAEATSSLAEYKASLLHTNGIRVNGIRVNGIRVNGIRVNGTELSATIVLNGTELVLADANGLLLYSGTGLVGATIPTELATGEVVQLTIESVTFDAAAGAYLYEVTYPNAKNGKAEPLCDKVNGKAVRALALAGTYSDDTGANTPDPSRFTFACVNAAIGKCALWGYHPGKTRQECLSSLCKQQPLPSWHQACIRMVRADYCGDGVPHTRDGTAINVWDNLGIESPDPSSWEMEAEWTQDGARCIRHTRWLQADSSSTVTDLEYVRRTCPSRLAENQPTACNSDRSDFFSSYGFHLATDSRRLLRNQSEGGLTNRGDAKK